MMLGIFDENGNTVVILVLTVTSQEIYMFFLLSSRKENALKCTANMHVLSIRKMSITWEI
jgi:hypothetical protein